MDVDSPPRGRHAAHSADAEYADYLGGPIVLSEGDLRRRLSIAPTFDAGRHLREVRRKLIPAVIVAAIVGGLVYAFVAPQPAVYESSVTAKIEGQSTALSDVTVNTMAPPFVALSQSRPVLEDVINQTGSALAPEQLSKDVTVSVQTSPSLVLVSARADTAADSTALAVAMVTALDTSIVNQGIDKVTKDLADLQKSAQATIDQMSQVVEGSPQWDVLKASYDAQLQRARDVQTTPQMRISLLSEPGTAEKVAPLPWRLSLVSFVVALIVVAEVLVLLDGRLGRRTSAGWLRRQARRRGYAVDTASTDATTLPAPTQITLNKVPPHRGSPLVFYDADSSIASGFVGAAVANDAVDAGDAPRLGHTALRLVDSHWWREPGLTGRPLALVVVHPADRNRSALSSTFDALDRYGTPVQLVVIGNRVQRRGLR